MTDDLVKRLRETTHMYQVDCELKMKCADRIEELEAKLAKARKFVQRFACQTRKIDHIGLEEWPLTEHDLSVQRDRDITTARALLAELTGGNVGRAKKAPPF